MAEKTLPTQPPAKRPPVTRMVPSQRPRDHFPLDQYPELPPPSVTLSRGRPPQQGPVPYFMKPPRPDVVVK